MRRDAKRLVVLAALGVLVVATLPGRAPAQDRAGELKIAQPAADSTAPAAPAAPATPSKAAPGAKGKDLGAAADTVRQLEVAVEKDSASFDKNYRLGVAYLDRDRGAEAIEAFKRCTRLRPGETKGWVNLGAAQDAMGRGAEARISYRTALALTPYDEIALCRIGASHYSTGSKAAAMDTLRLALAKHPSSYCAYFTLGVAFADAQMYREAIRAWEKVIEVGPNTPEALSAKESIATLRDLMNAP